MYVATKESVVSVVVVVSYTPTCSVISPSSFSVVLPVLLSVIISVHIFASCCSATSFSFGTDSRTIRADSVFI